ncbi:HAD family hydrolase [Paenibacillus sp. Leaf72]|uniref:HAD family hydrolase n=1 Tax=Paenibacillus sp. Leaf72 TaxID=1736234 RepID=UPI0009D700A6|nr:HAD family hydrolase [Paenibacillus sp. Leaf72]
MAEHSAHSEALQALQALQDGLVQEKWRSQKQAQGKQTTVAGLKVDGGKPCGVEAILFDKDGTIIDFVSMWGNWSELLASRYTARLAAKGLLLPKGIFPSLWGTSLDATGNVCAYDRNGPLAMGTMNDLYAIAALQGYKLGLSWGESMQLVRESKEEADGELKRRKSAIPLVGVVPFIEQCKKAGLKLGIVTADDTEAAREHLEWMGLLPHFSVIVGADLVPRSKPYPDMLELACQELGVAPSSIAIIGDTDGDMRMGQAAGAALCIGIANQAASVLPSADVIIASYSQLAVEEAHTEG